MPGGVVMSGMMIRPVRCSSNGEVMDSLGTGNVAAVAEVRKTVKLVPVVASIGDGTANAVLVEVLIRLTC